MKQKKEKNKKVRKRRYISSKKSAEAPLEGLGGVEDGDLRGRVHDDGEEACSQYNRYNWYHYHFIKNREKKRILK